MKLSRAQETKLKLIYLRGKGTVASRDNRTFIALSRMGLVYWAGINRLYDLGEWCLTKEGFTIAEKL